MNRLQLFFKMPLYCLALAAIATACQPATEKSGKSGDTNEMQWLYKDVSFDMPRVKAPDFPEYQVNIKDFGAVPDGKTLNSEAFEKAINDVAQNGGGRVIIPRGVWLTGPIKLKSNVNLHTEVGALVKFSENFDLYPLIETSFEGLNTYRCISPIYGKGLENIAITGKGVFDGGGDAWRPVKRSKMTQQQWDDLIASGGVLNDEKNMWYPSEESLKGDPGNFNVPQGRETLKELREVKDFLRPVMVSLRECKNVLLDGPTFQNSPAWCLHPLMSENVILRNLTVRNPWYSQNGDGLDLESCKNSLVYNCNFDVGDDAICIKSGKNKDGRERGMPTENLIVKNCIVYHGHGGFVVGSEMSGGVKNMHVSQCTFMGTDVGLRFKSTRGRGGVVENIYISDIDMTNIATEAIRFNLYYSGQSPIPEPEEEGKHKPLAIQEPTNIPEVDETTPSFRDIYMENILCRGAKQAIFMQGLPEMNLKNVNLKNVKITAQRGLQCIDADSISIDNLALTVEQGPFMHFYNSQNVSVKQLAHNSLATEPLKVVRISGSKSKNITIADANIGDQESDIMIDASADKKALLLQ